VRGIPNHPVICGKCGGGKGCPKDRRCHSCRIKSRPNPNKRFFWTADLDNALVRAYRRAGTRRELTSNLNHVQRLSGFTRVVILSRAEVLGLSFAVRRPWNEAEVESLREDLGTLNKSQIARRLGRTYYSVKAQVARIRLSARVSSDYSQQDVEELLGVGRKRVCQWIRNGWLHLLERRITETSLEKFLRLHPEEYQLNRVDEAWFKGMLFPSFGRPGNPCQNASRAHDKIATSPSI
jgi:hypothetical protein